MPTHITNFLFILFKKRSQSSNSIIRKLRHNTPIVLVVDIAGHEQQMNLLCQFHTHPVQHLMNSFQGNSLQKGSGDSFLIRFGLKDINTPGRARIHQVSSRRDRLRYLNAFLLYVPLLN